MQEYLNTSICRKGVCFEKIEISNYSIFSFIKIKDKMASSPPNTDILKKKINKFNDWQKRKHLDKKKHQITGLKFCLSIELQKPFKNGPKLDNIRGGIIADEMGLGKTMISFGLIFCNIKEYKHTLVALPLALLTQWKKEIKKHLGNNAFIYHGTQRNTYEAKKIREKAAIVITTYGILQLAKPDDWLFQREKPFDRLIADEAHHIRNQNKLYKNMMKIKAKVKWMVTGTPIQNRMQDLISLCNVVGINPDPVNIKKKLTPEFRNIIKNHMIKRTKKQLKINLPPLIEKTIKVKWESEEEKNLAEEIHANMKFTKPNKKNVNKIIKFLGKGAIVWLIRMRQVCIYPKLLKQSFKSLENEGFISELIEDEDEYKDNIDNKNIINLRNDNIKNIENNDEIIEKPNEKEQKEYNNLLTTSLSASSKINSVIDTILNQPRSQRKIIFCHYRQEINIIKSILMSQNIFTSVIDGRANQQKREIMTQRIISHNDFKLISKSFYNQPKDTYNYISRFLAPEVLIIQIQTASEGLNLQHFNQVYFTSPWWNPALEDQAVARAHRIGQKSPVKVFRFVMEGFGKKSITLDEYCMQIQEVKRQLK